MKWKTWSLLLRRRIRYRVAPGGVLFTLALALVGAAAVVSANNLLFLIVATMLGTLLVSGLFSRLVLAGLELELVLPEHIPARRKISARLRLRNIKRWMPSFSIRVAGDGPEPTLAEAVYFPILTGGQTLEEPVDVIFPRRGAHTENLFVFSTRFPFGFLEKTARVTLRRETVVYPPIEPRAGLAELLTGITGEIETHLRGIGTDFYRIRPYQPSESARHVDWKSTAHTGGLQIREFTRDERRTVAIFLDRDAVGQTEWFEAAVECCAFLAWEVTARDIPLDFRSQGFEIRVPETGDVYTILKFLAFVEPQSSRRGQFPADEGSYQILVSANPRKFLDSGWRPARVLDVPALAVPSSGPTAASSAAKQN